MTDSEYIELTNKLKSFTEGADGLRDVWSGKKREDLIRSGVKISVFPDETIILPDGSMILPKGVIKMRLSNAIQRTEKLMDGCKDYSSYHLASILYKTMDDFVSETSNLPEDLMKMFVPVQDRCREIMDVLKPSRKAMTRADEKRKAVEDFKRSLLASQAFADAKEARKIDDQLDWKRDIQELPKWLYDNLLIPVKNTLSAETVLWGVADGVFTHAGKVITKSKLISGYSRVTVKDVKTNG